MPFFQRELSGRASLTSSTHSFASSALVPLRISSEMSPSSLAQSSTKQLSGSTGGCPYTCVATSNSAAGRSEKTLFIAMVTVLLPYVLDWMLCPSTCEAAAAAASR